MLNVIFAADRSLVLGLVYITGTTPKTSFTQRFVWSTFEYPETSTIAFVVSVVSVSVTLTAIVMLCLETHGDVIENLR